MSAGGVTSVVSNRLRGLDTNSEEDEDYVDVGGKAINQTAPPKVLATSPKTNNNNYSIRWSTPL
jgi:hypothetical protein